MKFPTSTWAGMAAFGMLLGGAVAQAQPVISGVFPDGSYQFQSAAKLSFSVTSSVGITNITVTEVGTNLLNQANSLGVYTTAKGLTITGANTSESVSAPLGSNTLYGVTVVAQDANGGSATTNLNFDTIVPAYTFEAEDYDYTLNGIAGSFFDNPQTNAYAGVTSTAGTDCNNPLNNGNPNGSAGYRVNSAAAPALATEGNGDKPPRIQYINRGKTDYDWGYTGGGQWGNYTRHFPAGVYNVFVRSANNNGASANAGDFSVVSGTGSFGENGSSGPYNFAVPSTGGWQNYTWVPVVDSSNNLAEFFSDGSESTIKVNCDNASFNADYYLLVLANTNPPVAGSVVITNLFPDGSLQFQQTNTFVFTAYDTNPIDPSTISVQLKGTSLTGSNTIQVLSVGSGLAATGASTNLSVVGAGVLSPNTTYAASIQIKDAEGNLATTNFTFDTVSNYYTLQASDGDYQGGQFIDNPETNAYAGLDGLPGIDYNETDVNASYATYPRFSLPVENCGDVPRAAWSNPNAPYRDFDVGNTHPGDWANYSRTYPAGVYNIYLRAASANSGTTADSASLYIVSPTQPDTTGQSVSKLGTFSVTGTGGWQTYTWLVLKNSAGYPAQFNVGSVPTIHTLRATTDSGGYNAHYYMLVPADLSVHNPPFINGFEPDGTTLFQITNQLSFMVNSQAGISVNGITLNLNGVNVSGLMTSGSANILNVSYPILANEVYTAVVTVADAYGTNSTTFTFDTLDPNTYTFEAEDYDYTSNGIAGLFIDNPQTNGYAGLSATEGVDEKDDNHSGAGYRPISGTGGAGGLPLGGFEFETPSGDWLRPQYSGGGLPDYNIGFDDGGNWGNYTRNYPTGTYNVYIRAASPNGNPVTVDSASVSLVTGGWGTPNQTTTKLGSFTIQNTGGWHTFGWAPLIDASGNYVIWKANGSTNTLRVTVDNGGYNSDFYALVPANTSKPVLSGLYPSGTSLFQGTNTLSFTASSSTGIVTNNVILTLNGVTVSNLVFTGSSTNWTVSDPNLKPNTIYSAKITVISAGGSSSETISFDTYSATNYQWEAEDWDYTSNGVSGLFVDNPQVDAYRGLDATENVDISQINTNTLVNPYDYRAYDGVNLTPAQEPSGDLARPQFGTNVDYKVDWFGYGSWLNYTRHYPAGNYNIIGRFTEGSADTIATLSEVKAANGHALGLLGTFHIPNGGWGTSEFVTLTDSSGDSVVVTLDGLENTLRLEGNPVEAGDPTINAGFFMLIPAIAPSGFITLQAMVSGGNIVISFPTQNGSSYQLEYKNNLTDPGWTSLGSAIPGNGSVQSVTDTNTATGGHRYYRVAVQ